MKVLLASPYGGVPGGISRWTEHIMSYYNLIQNPNCELTLLPMGRSSFVSVGSGLFYRLKAAFLDYKHIISSYKKLVKENKYDVMHLTSSASLSLLKDLYMLRYAHKNNIKTVIHFRFGRIPELAIKKNWEWKLLRKVVSLANTVIVLDKQSYDTLREHGYKNVIMLPNPVAPGVNTIVEYNSELKRIPNTILFTGHVIKTKGVYELIEACNQIPGVKLRMVGHVEDDMKQSLLPLASCDLEIIGEMPYEDVIKEMLKCDVFVLPTYTEGFPNVILESMAAGCAIVTTNVGAIPQMLEDEDGKKYGIIVNPRDVQSLVFGIKKLLTDEELKAECRRNVKVRVNERYSIGSIWNSMCEIWSQTLM